MTPLLSCRALASRARHGSLATLARDRTCWPFTTLVALAFDDGLRPLLCISALAEHTKNLLASPQASILVADAAEGVDPLASGRMTLVGPCARVPDDEVATARTTFLAAHPEAAGYATFADFAMWRLEVEGVWWVGGFGSMEWVALT
jgi:putative heme iron utilization protein